MIVEASLKTLTFMVFDSWDLLLVILSNCTNSTVQCETMCTVHKVQVRSKSPWGKHGLELSGKSWGPTG